MNHNNMCSMTYCIAIAVIVNYYYVKVALHIIFDLQPQKMPPSQFAPTALILTLD